MKRFLLLLLLPLSSLANEVTVYCPDASIVSTGPKTTITCGAVVAPTNPPVQPPPPVAIVTPVIPAPTVCGGAPVSPAILGVNNTVTSQLNVINTWRVPKTSGIASIVNEGRGAPTELQSEISLSRCPGDYETYKTEAAKVASSARSGKQIVCGALGPTPSIKWNQPGGCVIPAGETWYLNVRFVSGVPPAQTFSISLGISL